MLAEGMNEAFTESEKEEMTKRPEEVGHFSGHEAHDMT